VPHFEKMLYDQAQLVNVYLDAFAAVKDNTYSYVARDVLDYLIRDMTHPEGGIYSAEDADSAETTSSTRKKEGLFYIWTLQEVKFTMTFILSCATFTNAGPMPFLSTITSLLSVGPSYCGLDDVILSLHSRIPRPLLFLFFWLIWLLVFLPLLCI
jgi:hypothetical protein